MSLPDGCWLTALTHRSSEHVCQAGENQVDSGKWSLASILMTAVNSICAKHNQDLSG